MKETSSSIFRQHGGRLRMSEALRSGITRYRLYALLDKGIIERVSRGVYQLADLPPISDPDLVTVGLRLPEAVVCLVSALAFHEITTQIPHAVSVAIPKNSRVPSLDHPPIDVHKFSPEAYAAGIGTHEIDGVRVQVYTPGKTLADCFKFRSQLGMDIVLEALRLYRSRMRFDHKSLLHYARICRVEKVMRPYLEAVA